MAALPELPDDRRARPRRYPPAVGSAGSGYSVRTPPDGYAGTAAVSGAESWNTADVSGHRGGHRPGSAVVPPPRPGAFPPPVRRLDPADRPTEAIGSPIHEPAAEGTAAEDPATENPAAENSVQHAVDDAVASVPPEFPGRHRRRAGESPDERPAAAYRARAEADRKAAGAKKARPGRRRRDNFWRELPILIVVALVMTFLIQTFIAKVYIIPSGSMETTLHGCTGCTNDRVLVDKVSYRFGDPQPGDVVVFRGPDSWVNTEFTVPESNNALVNGLQQLGSLVGLAPPDEKDFVKRVIAVGGQTVQCCDSRNRVLVDGEPLDEPYIFYLPAAGGPRQEPFDPVVVPEGQLWLMGDSRNNSADSRYPGHGPVPIENVIGQARVIVLPLSRFSWVPSIDPQPADAVGMADEAGTGGAPLALGLLGTLPVAIWRRRRAAAAAHAFLPDTRS